MNYFKLEKFIASEIKEIDFVVEKEGIRIYIQVTYLIASQAVKKREFGNLLDIPDNY